MNFAAWGPTVVAVITCIFFAGVLRGQQSDTAKRVDAHDDQLEDHTRDLTDHAVKLGKLEAWRDGYGAARAVSERPMVQVLPPGDVDRR